MEHLPQPKGRVLNPIEVPYIVIKDIHAYDGERLTFSQFRQAHGFDEQTIERRGWNAYARSSPGGGQTESSRVVASFLQEWLFFGLLYEVLREDFKSEDFLCKEEGSPWTITTSKLPGLLWSYKRRWKSMGHDQHAQAQRRTRTWACLDEASDFVNKFLGSESAREVKLPLQEGIVLSITIIVGTLSAAAAEVYNRVQFVITRPKYVDRLLLNHRWCPTTLAMLERRGLGPQGMFYAAMLGPLPSNRDHSSCSKDGFECKANNVDQDTYQTAHRPDCMDVEHISKSNCPFEYVDHDRLCAEIESVETHPVIVVSNESDLTFRLDLQRSNPRQPFVAISHVWMDGMGNNNGNALARCQLWLLQRLVNSLYGTAQTEPIPFWIDTLCVPKEPRESRRKAITKMAAVYQDADKVLVLDANLFANPLASCERDCTEIFMRILSTNWMRRLWTFQEAVLGTSLYFAFPDGVIDMQDNVSSLRAHLRLVSSSISQLKDSELPNVYPGQAISRTALEQYTRLRDLREKKEEDRLAVVWNNMKWRSTSWTGDETICMAIILRFIPREIGEIQNIEVVYVDPTIGPEEKISLEALQRIQLAARYKLFLKFLERRRARIPMGLVFARGDKFDETGFRWAPSSFFRTAASGTIVAAEPTGQVTDAGLDVKAPGFELYLPPTPFKPRFVMLDELTSTFYDVDYATPLVGNKVRWEDLAPESIPDPALILAEDVALIAPDARIGVFGLLVSITRRTEQTLVANYLGRVFVRKFPATLMSWEALTKMKGVTRASKMKAGLMARLWNRRPGVPQSSGSPWVTSPEILDQMPDRWCEDGAALNYELDYMFASSRYLLREQKWCLR